MNQIKPNINFPTAPPYVLPNDRGTADFIELVRQMRGFQKKFFKTHDASYMRKAMALENQVDSIIQEYQRDKAFPDLKHDVKSDNQLKINL